MGVIRYAHHPLADRGMAWDGPAQVAAAEPADLKVMCTWFDGDGKVKGDYKLPHHLAENKHTVWRGVTAAMGALLGARGGADIPDSDRRGCYNHLSGHYRDFKEEPPEFRAEPAVEFSDMELIDDLPQLARAEITAGGITEDAEVERALRLINERHAREPLTAEQVFLFPGEMSSRALDSYWTRMHESSLRNYAADASSGVALMNSHRTGGWVGSAELPIGRSYWGEAIPGSDGLRALANYYMLRDWSNGSGLNTDDAIRGIQAGVISALSVGFGGPDIIFRCSICGNNMLDWDACKHYPGMFYQVNEQKVRAMAEIENARLREVSLVYKGATPNAGILRKATEAIRKGTLSPAQARDLEEAYHVRIIGKSMWTMPARPANGEGDDMELKDVQAIFPEINLGEADDVQAALANIRAALTAQAEAGTTAVAEARAEVAGEIAQLMARVAELAPLADMGRQYFTDLIDETIKARVRIQGVDFDAGQYRAKLEQFKDMSFIKNELATWQGLASRQFTAGRQIDPRKVKPGAPPADSLQYKA